MHGGNEMIGFKDVLAEVGLPISIQECALGKIRNPVEGLHAPFYWYGFPPALIPIWSEASGPNYYGYWKHWFVDREPSFVKMYLGAGREVVEIARSADQLFCYMVVRSICIDDGVEPAVEVFASSVGINNLSEIDEATLDTGDNPKGLINIPQFKSNTPLVSVENESDYDGDLQTQNTLSVTSTVSSFEFSKEVIDSIGSNTKLPAWFYPDRVKDVFYDALKGNDLSVAWLSLNSAGWSIVDAKSAMQDLAENAKDEQFDKYTSWWLSIADESVGGY